MFKGFRLLITALLALAPLFQLFAQNPAYLEYDSGYSHRELSATNPEYNAANPFQLFHYHDMTSYDDSKIWEGTYVGKTASGGSIVEFMNWRIILPKGFTKKRVQKWPMIVMLHGAGEGGRVWTGSFNYTTDDVRYDNNSLNVAQSEATHYPASQKVVTDPKAFPGVMVFPQASYNAAWESNWDNGNPNQNSRMVEIIIRHMIDVEDVDPDRIYMHGLSNGAKGTWDFASKHPDLIAAILPMSGVPSDPNNMVVPLVTTPVWLFQGGIDTNPRPQASLDAIAVWNAAGGTIRYTLYPTLGHGTWGTAYNEPDFWSWMLSQSKKNIYVFGGDPRLCPSGAVKLGFSANFKTYQWFKDGVPISGETTRYYTATAVGSYTVQYERYTDISKTTTEIVLSNPTVVTTKPASTYTPPITQSGSNYEQVEVGGVFNYLTLTAPTGFSNYVWYKNGTQTTTTDPLNPNVLFINTDFGTQYGKSADAGVYTMTLKDAGGCTSQTSAPITVYYNATQPNTGAPSTPPSLQILSQSSIKVTWTDFSNEVKYELYRARKAGAFGGPTYSNQGWNLIATLPANTVTYTDQGLRPGAKYQYEVRMLLADGTSRVTPETDYNDGTTGVTLLDTSPPSTPTGLAASNLTSSQVTLSWTASTDDDIVYKYIVYNGSTVVGTVVGANDNTDAVTTAVIPGLIEGSTNIFTVQAFDYSNNASTASDAVTVTLGIAQNGLTVKYWPTYLPIGGTNGSQLLEPGGVFDFTATPKYVGTQNSTTAAIPTFDPILIAATDLNTPDPNDYVLAFDGYINLPGAVTATTYQFQLSGTGGSRLYVNAGGSPTLSLNDDGDHCGTNNIKTGNFVVPANATGGKYPIRLTYYDEHCPTTGNPTVNPTALAAYLTNLKLYWKINSGSTVQVPNTSLFLTGTTQTNYYLANGADPSLTASWGTATNGTGTHPSGFTNNYCFYNINTATAANLAAGKTLPISGTGSKLILGVTGTARTLTLAGTFTGSIDILSSSTLNITSATATPTFGAVDPTSTVNYSLASGTPITFSNATFGKVNFQSAGAITFPSNATIFAGDVTFVDGATTVGAGSNLSSVKFGGNVTFGNTAGSPLPGNSSQYYSLIFTGGKTHTVTFASAVDPSFFSLTTDFSDNIVFVNPNGPHIYTFGTASGGGLTLKGGSVLNIGTDDLIVDGAGTINPNSEGGAIAMSGGNLSVTSNSPLNSEITFNAATTLTNLTVSSGSKGSVNLLSPTNVTNLVTLNAGQLNGGSDANLVLMSDGVNGTARIGPIPSGARINGNISAQRFMSNDGVKIYKYISSPVKLATAAMLQQSFQITGNFTGHDVISGVSSSSASMYWYSEPNYQPFPANGGTNADTMKVGRGYTAYIRKIDGPTTFTVTGNPNQGSVNFTPLLTPGTSAANDGWNLLGNPYPAPIKWTGSTSNGTWSTFAGISTTVYVRDNTASGFQWYVYRPGITGGSLQPGQSILLNGIIAPGQAFWVQATGTPTPLPQLVITENAKQVDDGIFYRQGPPSKAVDVMSIIMSNGTLSDVTYIVKDDAGTENYEKSQDAVKQFNSTFNLSTLSKDNVSMVINVTPATYCEKNTRLSITGATAGTYTFAFKGIENFNQKVNMSLKDNFLGTTTTITPDYVHTFSITSDAASQGSDRFVLTENPVVTTALSLAGSSVCESNPHITIAAGQNGVTYQALFNNVVVSDSVMSNGDSVLLTLNKKMLGVGTHAIAVTGSVSTCGQVVVGQTINVTVDSLQLPVINLKSGYLQAYPNNAEHYQWSVDGRAIMGKTQTTLLQPGEGTYQVQIKKGVCSKISGVFSVTGLGESGASTFNVYPNPFTDKITVSVAAEIADGQAILYNAVGQPMQTTSFTVTDSHQAELRFPNLESGAYILGIAGRKVKIIKVN